MTSPTRKSSLPPTAPVTIKKEREDAAGSYSISGRRDSFGLGSSDDFMNMITHTPPAFSPGSLNVPLPKRNRSGSVSSRLLSAADLEERGIIDKQQKGVLKDLIISGGDEALQKALEKFDAGDASSLEAMLDQSQLNTGQRKSSLEVLDDLDFGFLNVGSLGGTPKEGNLSTSSMGTGGEANTSLNTNAPPSSAMDEWDDLNFEAAFADVSTRDILEGEFFSQSLGTSLPNSLPTVGLGITPPTNFSFGDELLDNSAFKSEEQEDNAMQEKKKEEKNNSISRPIGIPSSEHEHKISTQGPTHQKNVGAYSPESRRKRIEKFLEKRQKRVWRKEVKYDVRKNFADSRLRVKGRFVKKEDEQLLRELLSLT